MTKDTSSNKHKGSSLDSFLEEEGVLVEFKAQAIKEVIARQRDAVKKRDRLNRARSMDGR